MILKVRSKGLKRGVDKVTEEITPLLSTRNLETRPRTYAFLASNNCEHSSRVDVIPSHREGLFI